MWINVGLNIYIKNKSNEEIEEYEIKDWSKLIIPHMFLKLLKKLRTTSKRIFKYILKLTKPLPGDIDKVIDRYKSASQHLFTPASPTLFNSGTNYPQMASCFLLSIPDDLITNV